MVWFNHAFLWLKPRNNTSAARGNTVTSKITSWLYIDENIKTRDFRFSPLSNRVLTPFSNRVLTYSTSMTRREHDELIITKSLQINGKQKQSSTIEKTIV